MNRIEKWNEITGAEQEQGMMEAFLESRTDSYAILQLRDIDETRQEQFASLDYLHRRGKEPDIDHYEILYTADLPTFTDRDVMLEFFIQSSTLIIRRILPDTACLSATSWH